MTADQGAGSCGGSLQLLWSACDRGLVPTAKGSAEGQRRDHGRAGAGREVGGNAEGPRQRAVARVGSGEKNEK